VREKLDILKIEDVSFKDCPGIAQKRQEDFYLLILLN
jgi:hypothetical protein